MSTNSTTLSRTQQAKLAAEILATQPTPDWDSVAELKKWRSTIELKGEKKTLKFDDLVNKYKDVDAEISYREKIKDALKMEIQAAILVADIQKVSCEGYSVSLVERKGSRKIMPEKLLEAGVTAMQIAQATEIGPSSQYIQIRAAKDDKL